MARLVLATPRRGPLALLVLIALVSIAVGAATFPSRGSGATKTSGQSYLLTPANTYCNFSTYNTSPENPARTKLAYTCFPTPPASDHKNKSAEVWVSNLDGTSPVKIADVTNIDAHNGARFDWVDNDSLLYWNNFNVEVRNINTLALERTRPGYPGERTSGTKIVVFEPDDTRSALGYTNHISVLDVATNVYTPMVTRADFASFSGSMGGSNTPSDWRITHPRLNEAGTKIAFSLTTDPLNSSSDTDTYLFSFDVANPANITFFGRQPQHWVWYGGSFIGHDHSINDGHANDNSNRWWDLSGNWIQDMSGPGNHLGFGLFGTTRYFASDTMPQSNPIVLTLYTIGSVTGTTIFSSSITNPVWSDGKSHVNPSFARNGSRLYYVKPTAHNRVQGYYYEL